MRILYILIFIPLFTITGCTSNGEKEPYKSTKSTLLHEQYVGAESCKECHQEAYADWKKSDHFYSMQKATKEFVKANFNTTYSADEIQYKFYTQDTTYFVEITEANQTHTFKVAYTFGWHPLQQYLLETENGKFQTLRASWDTENNKWFHQNAGDIVEPHDWLSWSKGGQNWNTMCSSCHSTHLKKNYNEVTDNFNTTFKEINVACESCHGPGVNHIGFQSNNKITDPYQGGILTDQKAQINNCGTCHARRTMFEDVSDPHNEFLDQFIPQNLTSTFYEGDGQIKGEDFVYGSFLSSRMYRNHVACNNCHNSHSGEIKMEGNSLCLQCHEPQDYDTQKHHHHTPNTEGASCVSCHMDGKVYMGNDYRKDHSFRIPRPDQSVKYETSNSCNSCHTDKDAKWAATAVTTWYGKERAYHFSDDLLPASKLNEQSMTHIENLLSNDSVPTIIKSTAIEYLQYLDDPMALDLILKSLSHKEALVRQSGYVSLLWFPENIRVDAGLRGLSDPVKAVRIMAFRTVISIDVNQLNPEIIKIWNNVNAEYLIYLKTNADFPSGQTLIGEYYQQVNDTKRAITAFNRALKMDSVQLRPYSNLAILYSGINDLASVKKILLQGTELFPNHALYYYYLGLNEGELGNLNAQLNQFKKAYLLNSTDPKIAYNYILSLYNLDAQKEAKKQLVKALIVNPNNKDLYELDLYFKQQ